MGVPHSLDLGEPMVAVVAAERAQMGSTVASPISRSALVEHESHEEVGQRTV